MRFYEYSLVSARKNAVIAVDVAVLALFIVLLFTYEYIASVLPPCSFLMTTGYYCPMCGLTRSYGALIRFDIPAAASHNLFLFVSGIYAFVILFWLNLNAFFAVRIPKYLISMRVLIAFLFFLLVFAILRNVPYFTWLFP